VTYVLHWSVRNQNYIHMTAFTVGQHSVLLKPVYQFWGWNLYVIVPVSSGNLWLGHTLSYSAMRADIKQSITSCLSSNKLSS